MFFLNKTNRERRDTIDDQRKKKSARGRGIGGDRMILQTCPICGRVCLENARDLFGEIVGCESCISFEEADEGNERHETSGERMIL